MADSAAVRTAFPASDVLSGALGPVVRQCGADLEGIEVREAGSRLLLRVVVDRDGGVDLDAVALISSAVSSALDDSDVLGESPYVLEVTSPGVDRPLTLPRHWFRARGRLVRIEGTDGELVGRVLESDEAGVTVQTDSGPHTIAFAAVQHAVVEVEFSRPGEE